MTNSIKYEVIHSVIFSFLLLLLCCCIQIFSHSPCFRNCQFICFPYCIRTHFTVLCLGTCTVTLSFSLFSSASCFLFWDFSAAFCIASAVMTFSLYPTDNAIQISLWAYTWSDLNSVRLHNTQYSKKKRVLIYEAWFTLW